jgi:peptidyl-prolyl cis-trans isomerase B (cyclophilin B)
MMRTHSMKMTPRRFQLISAAVLLVVLGASGCGESSESPPEEAPASGAPAVALPPAKQIDRKHPVVRIDTSLGSITVRLDGEKAPVTVSNFLNYVNEGFYRDTIFHFVDADKLIMAGGYSANYELKPAGSPIRNEAHNGLRNVRGSIAMARNPSLIDSANSQFFINLADAPIRDHTGDSAETYGYCVFGQVTEGMDVAERISRSPTTDLTSRGADLGQTPQAPVVITAVQIVM